MSGAAMQRQRRGPCRARALGVATVTAALIAGGCSSQSFRAGARLSAPTAVVLFRGVTNKNAGLHAYLAVTSSRTDSLALIDPVDDQPVLSPIVAYPLAITTDPRPQLLAAAALGDGGADVLATVGAGSRELEVVETWTATNRIAPSASVSLTSLLGSAEILTLTGVTPASASASSPRARILVGASGGKLVVVDFLRDPATGGVVPQQPVVKDLGFDPADVALEPGGPRAFFATTDPIASGGATVQGVAWVDVSGDATLPWTATAVDAGAPTTAIAVGQVRERLVDSTNPYAPSTFDATPRLRVYAVVDPSACGPDRAIACGVAMLDDHGPLPDPSGELPARAPLPVPGRAVSVAIAYPPASGTGVVTTDTYNPGVPLMSLYPGGANTSAVAAVTSTDGFVYLYDLSRYAPSMTASPLLVPTGVSSALAVVPADVSDATAANYGKDLALGLWNDFPVAGAGLIPAVSLDGTRMYTYVRVTPGITPSDTWIVTWQGVLPALAARPGVVGRTATGDTYVALQANAGTATQPAWVASVNVADPALGIHGGDLVTFAPDDTTICPATDVAHPYPELAIDASAPLLAPDAASYPGGALKVAGGGCFAALAPGDARTGIVTIRASAMVLTSNALGYLGRPTFDRPFVLAHQDERTATGEALVVSRKIRRIFYPVEPPCASAVGQPATPGCYGAFPLIADPIASGPAIAFHVGLPGGLDATDPAVLARIPRDARLLITSSTGIMQGSMIPLAGGVLPTRSLAFDRSGYTGHENEPTWIYTVYRDDQLLEFAPSYSGGSRRTLR